MPPRPVRAVISLGSNRGDSLAILTSAAHRLRGLGKLAALSSLYLTQPWGEMDQDDFYNAVAVLETSHPPVGLLESLHRIEDDFARERVRHWGPRTLDLDVVLFGDQVVEQDGMVVPHPHYRQRRFVLEPLLEIWPQACHPDGTPVVTWQDSVSDQQIERLAEPHWPGPWAWE